MNTVNKKPRETRLTGVLVYGMNAFSVRRASICLMVY